jgi:predicted kinase
MSGAREHRPILVLMAGLPGSGKSTLALAIGGELGWPVVDKDILERVLRNDAVANPTDLAYELSLALMRDLLVEQRQSVILDSPLGNASRLQKVRDLTTIAESRLCVILCLAGRDTRNRRMVRRVDEASRAWREPVRRTASQIADDGRAQYAFLGDDAVSLDTTAPLPRQLESVLRHIR